MIFARYKGPEEDGGLIQGKTYLAKPEMDGAAGMCGFFEVEDELNAVVRINPDKGQFEFLEEVYAVVTRPFNGFAAGEVVVATDASVDGKLLNVKGEGFCSAGDLAVLDRTNVSPGVVVCDTSDGVWRKVARVDEALWVMPQGGKAFRSPEEFRFPVSHDGELMVEPLVTCVLVQGLGPELTLGRRYYLAETKPDGNLVVENDVGAKAEYLPERFRMG